MFKNVEQSLRKFLILLGIVSFPCFFQSWFSVLFITALFVKYRKPSFVLSPVMNFLLWSSFGAAAALVNGNVALGILFVLFGVKVIETKSIDEVLILAVCGLFFGFLNLIFYQNIFVGALSVICMLSIIRQLFIQYGDVKLFKVFAPCSILFAVLMFIVTPRGGQWGLGNFSGNSGISSTMEPLKSGSVNLSPEIAFRVSMSNNGDVIPKEFYWRTSVLWDNIGGFSWLNGSYVPDIQPKIRNKGIAIEQKIMLEPSGTKFLPSLDAPVKIPSKSVNVTGGVFESMFPVKNRFTYEVTSSDDIDWGRMTPEIKERSLSINSSEKIKSIANSLIGKTDEETLNNIEAYFKNGFTYTLTPGVYSSADEFFDKKRGFCEHFSAAYVTLSRLCNIPSRVVTGYYGAEKNSDYYIIRRSHAHAWCEVWLNNTWKRIDPTAFVSQERFDVTWGAQWNNVGNSTWWKKFQAYSDSLDFYWHETVLGFDIDSQNKAYGIFGLSVFSKYSAIWFVFIIISILVIPIYALFYFSVPKEQRHLKKLSKLLGKYGVHKQKHEGWIDSLNKALAKHPEKDVFNKLILRFHLRYKTGVLNISDLFSKL